MKPSRRAYTLLEMLVVIAVGAVVIGIASTLAVSLLDLRGKRRAEHEASRCMLELQQQWRTDVRSAMRGVVGQDGAIVALTLPDGTVVQYRQEGAALHRTVHSDKKLGGRDHYLLPEGAQLECALPGTPGEVATLTIQYSPSAKQDRSKRVRPLQGVMGGDLRWHTQRTKGKE